MGIHITPLVQKVSTKDLIVNGDLDMDDYNIVLNSGLVHNIIHLSEHYSDEMYPVESGYTNIVLPVIPSTYYTGKFAIWHDRATPQSLKLALLYAGGAVRYINTNVLDGEDYIVSLDPVTREKCIGVLIIDPVGNTWTIGCTGLYLPYDYPES